MGRRPELIILVWCLVCAGVTHASESARTVTMAPGARYRAGWLYSFFLGEHWRDVWTTPIEVPVLDLEAFDLYAPVNQRPLRIDVRFSERKTELRFTHARLSSRAAASPR